MSLPLDPEAPPLRVDETGTVRVGPTRVLLETVVSAFWDGATPEQIVQSVDTLQLHEVYSAIGYYLRHRDAVDAYLATRAREADELRAKIKASQRPLAAVPRGRTTAERDRREAPHTDPEAFVALTANGEVTIDQVALVGGTILGYVPRLGWLPTVVEDNRLAARCKQLLARLGRRYDSRDAIPAPRSA